MRRHHKHPENDPSYKGLSVNRGVEGVSSVNPYQRPKTKRRQFTVEEYLDGILKGDTSVLSQAVTLIESALNTSSCSACRGLYALQNSIRLGITGVPEQASTFIEALGCIW